MLNILAQDVNYPTWIPGGEEGLSNNLIWLEGTLSRLWQMRQSRSFLTEKAFVCIKKILTKKNIFVFAKVEHKVKTLLAKKGKPE